ncbi:urease accessory protein UreD [Actinokineospora sp.]|uniref:urease accessory protein UreD n=1 Tax=Actinokineospora sp. TaxID=1872133 RepID=UPI0040383AD0
MRARASLAVELVEGRTVVRTIVSAAPLTLLARRRNGPVTVHMVNSAAAPLGGDDLALSVSVGPGASLRLVGVGATLALPGVGQSRSVVRIEVGDGGTCEYLPEPTVVTRRAHHHAVLDVALVGAARLRVRETLVLGRIGERAGLLSTETHVVRDGVALVRQRLDVGDPALDDSAAGLAGHRVLASELLVGFGEPDHAAGGDWWSLVPLARGGALATALAHDAVTAKNRITTALAAMPRRVLSGQS